MDSFSFFVPGEPITEGSTRAFASGQRVVVTHDRGPKLALWRLAVQDAALKAAREAGWEPHYDGPVRVTATFYLPRPKSAPASRYWPHVKPDLDKLVRAIGDALAPTSVPVSSVMTAGSWSGRPGNSTTTHRAPGCMSPAASRRPRWIPSRGWRRD